MKEIICDTNEMKRATASDHPSGAEIKVLRHGDTSRVRTVLLRLPPNWQMSEHSHTTAEQHFVLEGSYESQGRVFGVGSYRLIPRETEHGPFTTESGAVILVIWDPIGE